MWPIIKIIASISDARKVLLSPGPDLVICDEGHRIKNRKTNIAILLSKIKTRYIIFLFNPHINIMTRQKLIIASVV